MWLQLIQVTLVKEVNATPLFSEIGLIVIIARIFRDAPSGQLEVIAPCFQTIVIVAFWSRCSSH